jgi:phage gp45-like
METRCIVTNESDDQQDFPTTQVGTVGDKILDDCVRWSVYGVSYNPPNGTLGILSNLNGYSDDRVATFYNPLERLKLSPGEVAFHKPGGEQKLEFANDGSANLIAQLLQILIGQGSIEINDSGCVITFGANTITITDSTIEIVSPQLTHNGVNIGGTHVHISSAPGNPTSVPQ